MATTNNFIFYILAIFIGALIPIMAATNAAYSKAIGSPYVTTLVVFILALVSMALFLIFSRTSLPTLGQVKSAPLFGYLGGIIVVVYMVLITIIAPRIGVGNAIGLVVTGQILCVVIIDHFGLFNATIRTMDLNRLIGVILMIGGVYLVMKKNAT